MGEVRELAREMVCQANEEDAEVMTVWPVKPVWAAASSACYSMEEISLACDMVSGKPLLRTTVCRHAGV